MKISRGVLKYLKKFTKFTKLSNLKISSHKPQIRPLQLKDMAICQIAMSFSCRGVLRMGEWR